MKSLADALGTPDVAEALAKEIADVETFPQFVIEDPKSAQEFAKAVLNSQEYRMHLMRTINNDTINSTVERMLYDRAAGRVPDSVEITGKDGKPIDVVTRIVRTLVEPALREETEQVSTTQRLM